MHIIWFHLLTNVSLCWELNVRTLTRSHNKHARRPAHTQAHTDQLTQKHAHRPAHTQACTVVCVGACCVYLLCELVCLRACCVNWSVYTDQLTQQAPTQTSLHNKPNTYRITYIPTYKYMHTAKSVSKTTRTEGPPVYKDRSGLVHEPLNQYCCTST